jgi:hypothetical protein
MTDAERHPFYIDPSRRGCAWGSGRLSEAH